MPDGLIDPRATRPSPEQVRRTAQSLRDIVAEITDEEFRWQDARYGRDSRYGREALFLIADSAWILATSEGVDISRSDAIDTTVKMEIDVSRITHEAFHSTEGSIWLPLLVMAADQVSAEPGTGQQPGSPPVPDDPDPFISLTVSDAAGSLLPTVPAVDVRHWISAAMAEIIVNMAAALWVGRRTDRPVPTRDQRLVLAAAIYRRLSGGTEQLTSDHRAGGGRPSPADHRAAGRLAKAKHGLAGLLGSYIADYERHRIPPRAGMQPGTAHSFGAVLTERAVQVLEAFTQTVVVVVPIEREQSPTVLTVRLPPRRLQGTPLGIWAPQRAELSIDLLMPSADADRQVHITLPDGVSLDPPGGGSATEMIIEVDHPQPLEDVADLMACLTQPGQPPLPPGGLGSVADLAAVKARGVAETLRQHLLCPPAPPGTDWDKATQVAYDDLMVLGADCDRLAGAQGDQEKTEEILETVIREWGAGKWLGQALRRRTVTEAQGPRSVMGRAALIENISQRPTPLSGKIKLRVEVTDAAYFSIARFAGVMSAVLMTVVGIFLAIAALRHGPHGSNITPSPEVLAGALTLFSAIQAGRIDHPDRSTLLGRLSASGNWRIVLSILPTIVLAVMLAFYSSGWTPVWAAGIAIAFQGLIQFGRLHSSRRQQLWTTPPPNYARLGVLRSSWWRSTTADALKLGRQAQGYVVWEHSDPPNLSRLLGEARPAIPTPATSSTPGTARKLLARLGPLLAAEAEATSGLGGGTAGLTDERPANILALLRGSTARQALTFVVFREQPDPDWAEGLDVRPVHFDPDRLAPMENASDAVEIFLSVPCPGDWPALAQHPIPAVLEAAADQRLVVLETNLPVPPPVLSRRDQAWARVRVGLRDGEIRRLPGFLNALQQRIGGNRWILPCDVLVRTTAGSDLRLLVRAKDSGLVPSDTGRSDTGRSDHPVSARDLDVVSRVTRPAGSGLPVPPRGEWRVLALCADAQAGIEADILTSLGNRWPGLRLAGLDHAVLHGLTVMLMLAHEPDGRSGRTELDALTQQYADAHATFLVDEWQTAEQLGQAPDEPVLRVNIRGPDQPGMVLDALESLYGALTTAMAADPAAAVDKPDQPEPPGVAAVGSGVWHALVRVTGTTTIRLAIRLTGATRAEWAWNEAKLEEIQRETLQRAVNAAQRQRAASLTGDRLGIAEDTVISVGLLQEAQVPQVMVPQPRPR